MLYSGQQMTDPQSSPALSPLYSPAHVKDLMARFGIRPTKSLGQNFLIDGNILRAIAEAGGAAPGVNVLEVGPGLGVLTREMAERGAQVTTLEKDEHLRPVLAETLAGLDVNIVWGDALEFDYGALPAGTRVIANLPYYITGPLLSRFMRAPSIISATVLVQKEVAQRLSSQPGDDNYGFLTALAHLYGTVRPVRDVPKGSFIPAPAVTSSVVRLDFDRERPQPSPAYIRLIDQALAHRRKTLRNNLKMAGYPMERVEAAMLAADLSPTIRAEAIPLEQLRRLADALGID